ncbi:MAG: hypothetical protein EZS28_008779 [Streblomastix strix]|uniref:Uncharacterized protein n=1 Tax=Streblomastix strix TaxID=222440 RepID=A0A5J4WMA7_9EUKA|nr:MAG: hypothetical protein EZS28_008779 [Streblomastix strix]
MPIKPQSKAGSKVKAQNTKIRQRSPSRAQHNPIGRRGMSLSPRRYNQLPPIQSELQINSKQQQLLPQKAQQQPLNQAITPVKQMQPSQSSQLQQKATSLSQLQPKQLTKEVRLANQIRFVQLLKKMHDHQRQQIERSEYEKKEISKRLNEIEQYSDEGKEQMEKQGNDSNTDQSYNIQIKQGMIGRSRSKTPKSLIRRPEFRVDLSDNSSEDVYNT